MGIAALVLGIIAFVLAVTFVLAPLGVVLAVIGLILGIVDIVKKGKTGEKKAIGMAGMILSAVMFVTLMVESFFILIAGIAIYDTVSDYDANRINSSIESSTIESFNSKFSGYEGSQTGSRVKIVLNNISINNSYNDHEIDVYYNGLMEEPDELKEKISSAQKYTITFYKDIDGYINRIYIMPSYSSLGENT
ncbi:MAG: DUF4190 domain-containing protein [Clostridia bacterium]|nr:DUF4190 domain-containing protein [Clostridia bacterium]